MRKTFSLLIALLLLMSVIGNIGFAQDEAVAVIAAGETVKIGLATDLSNIIPAPGQDIANGGQLAIDQYNEEMSGLLGFEVELVVEDDRCTGEDAATVANKFAADPQIVAVVGHVCSGASIPASEIYEEARIPMVSPSSTAGAFTARGLDVTNRTAFSDNVQGIVVGRYIASELGAESVAVLHDNTSYGEGLASTVSDTLEELGVEVTAFEVADPESQDFRPQLTVLAGNPPDVIYLGGYTNQAALIVAQMKEVGLEDTVFFSDDGVYNQDFLDLAGDDAEGTYVSFGEQIGNEEANAEFDAAYEEAFGVAPDEMGPFHAQTYDAANVILKALEAVAEVDADGNLVIDREALIEAIRATSGYEGLSGTITCDENGDCGSALISILVAEGGEWVAVEVPEDLQYSAE